MEEDVRRQDEAAREKEGEDLTAAMRKPKGDISQKSGDIERHAPLFRDTDAAGQGFLFQKDTDTENPVARSVRALIDDIEKMPGPDRGTRLDQVKDWLGSKAAESVTRTGDFWATRQGKVEKVLAKAKAVFAAMVDDYRQPPKETDWKREVGQMQLSRAETAQQMRGLAKELKEAAPDRLSRIGMTHWIEAGGDPAKLREWAVKARSRWENADSGKVARQLKAAWRDAVAHYEAAEKLTPQQKELAQRIKQHNDELLQVAKQEGLLEYGARNYVRHLYERQDAQDMLRLLDTNELNPDPSFVEKRIFLTYFEAEQNGMIPRDKDLGYLVAAYDKSFTQALASRSMLKGLLDAKASDGRPLAAIKMRGKWVIARGDEMPLVMEQRERPKTLDGYRQYDHAPTRGFLFEPTKEDLEGWEHDPKLFEEDPGRLAFRGDLIFHPEVANRVDDMLTPGWFDRNETAPQRIGHAVMKGSGLAKELMTAVAPFHMVQEGIHAMEHGVNPFKLPEIDLSGKTDESKTQRLLASNGLSLTDFDAEGLFSAKALKGLGEGVPGLNVALDTLNSFSRWQFEDYIPRLKMKMAMDAFERNQKRYPALSDRQVAERTATESNAAFGNLNTAFDGLHRSKTFKQMLRLSMFAPDFLEARMRFVGQALTPFGGEQRAALIRGALVMYVTARLVNALANQGDAKWDPEDAFSVVAGNRRFSLRTVQGDILHAVTDPRGFIYNRMNPLTTRPVVEFLSGRDQFGRQKSFPHQARDVAKSVLPFGIQKVINTSDEGWLDSIMTSTGLQAGNYRTPTEEETHKLYLGSIPDQPDDEEREAASRKYRQMEDALRAGQMKPAEVWQAVKDGEITPAQAARTIQRAHKTELQIEFASGGVKLPDAVRIFAKASPTEQMELRPILATKAVHQLPEMPQAEREKYAAQIKELLRSVPTEENQRASAQ